MSFDNHRVQAAAGEKLAGENLVPCLSGESMSPDACGQTHCRHCNMTDLHSARSEAEGVLLRSAMLTPCVATAAQHSGHVVVACCLTEFSGFRLDV